MFIASKGGRTTRQLDKEGIIMVCTRKDNKLKYKAAGQRRNFGRFPFDGNSGNRVANQMEHVNFWNDVSKIPDNLSRLSTNWKFRNFRNFCIH